jgi:RHH-type transcriptional regulator, proline utilization regulon repressor / proline dehydrogenase / delta 1-pyrroline-5-carboxylate dehydrogenase
MAAPKQELISEAIHRNFNALYRADEVACVKSIITTARLNSSQLLQTNQTAAGWITKIRANKKPLPGVADILNHFGMSTQEGIALMCLAEALLRIPDHATADALIRDKLSGTHWDHAMGQNGQWMLNAAGWALAITGKVSGMEQAATSTPGQVLGGLVTRLGQPVIREALRTSMRFMANQFVLGDTIDAAITRGNKMADDCLRFSYDMLGEGARTMADADRYTAAYENAIRAVGIANRANGNAAPSGISVKLSALHPRYEIGQYKRVMNEMVPRLIHLAELAAQENIFMLVDAEEADRLQLSLDVIDATLGAAKTGDWDGFGVAVQAYQKRTPATIDIVAELAKLHCRRLVVRLIKGAYWDTEIKRAQERGLTDFPVYTRKITTDVSYLACAKKLLGYGDRLLPVFGSHNAQTIASIISIAPNPKQIEFQRLQGMGDELFALLHAEGYRCCIYAPVGDYETLLGYLVRRLLENGANSSFVHKLHDPKATIAELTADPVAKLEQTQTIRHPYVKLPSDLFIPARKNSMGIDLTDATDTRTLMSGMAEAWNRPWQASPIVSGQDLTGIGAPVNDPAQNNRIVGQVIAATTDQVSEAFQKANQAFHHWSKEPVENRANILEKLADLLEGNRATLMALLVREAGKTINDALGEVREAADFCRYYAVRARQDFAPQIMPGPTGEKNVLQLHGRGVFVCVSPWNFPLAIFLGQIAAALGAGNTILAKPAPQTPLIAAYTVKLALQAGLPPDVLHLLPGGGEVGGQLVSLPGIAGVTFTGSVATAQKINRTLADRNGAIVPLIAETGGQNAMIVDTSALSEQVVDDVITSSFRSAGQRCSALRVLFLPEPSADSISKMLRGAMQELVIGDPGDLATDIGPVIDLEAYDRLQRHIKRLKAEAKEVYSLPLPAACNAGTFIAPQVWEIPDLSWLEGEVFGPILHVVRYQPDKLTDVLSAINATGFGLTGGVHSRIEETIKTVTDGMAVGNLYVNRSMIGAVVGVQPFGGEGLSGTGPKAGGPFYLPRFAAERVISTNTTAAGGNASLLAEVGKE